MTNRSRKILALALIVVGLFMVCVATVAQAAEQKTLFLWTSNNPPGEVDEFRLYISATAGGSALQDVTILEADALGYKIPAGFPDHNCGAEVMVQGEGVKTYFARIRAEVNEGASFSAWSEEISNEWNFLVAPGDLIIVTMQGTSAEIRVFERLADGSKKRKLFYYGGGS